MVGVSTSTITAEMVENHAFGDGAAEVFIDEAMRRIRFAFVGDDTVGVMLCGSGVFPTAVGLAYEPTDDPLYRILPRPPKIGLPVLGVVLLQALLRFISLGPRISADAALATSFRSLYQVIARIGMPLWTGRFFRMLRSHIGASEHIGSRIYRFKVFNIATKAITAKMIKHQSFGKGSVVSLIHQTMNNPHAPLEADNAISADTGSAPLSAPVVTVDNPTLDALDGIGSRRAFAFKGLTWGRGLGRLILHVENSLSRRPGPGQWQLLPAKPLSVDSSFVPESPLRKVVLCLN